MKQLIENFQKYLNEIEFSEEEVEPITPSTPENTANFCKGKQNGTQVPQEIVNAINPGDKSKYVCYKEATMSAEQAHKHISGAEKEEEIEEEEIDYTLKPASKQGLDPNQENIYIQKWLNTNNLLSGIEVSMAMVGKSSRQWLLSRKLKSAAGISGIALKKLFQAIKQFERTNPGLKIYALSILTTACTGGKGCDNGQCMDQSPNADCRMNVNRREAFLPGPSGKGIMWVAATSRKAKEVRNVRFLFGSAFKIKGDTARGKKARDIMSKRADKEPNIWIVLSPGSFNLEQTLMGFKRAIYRKYAKK